MLIVCLLHPLLGAPLSSGLAVLLVDRLLIGGPLGGPSLLKLLLPGLLLGGLMLLLRLRKLGALGESPSCLTLLFFLLLVLRLLRWLRLPLLLRLVLRRRGARLGLGLRGPSRFHLRSLLPTGLHASL